MKYLTRRNRNQPNPLWADFEDFFNAPSPFIQSLNSLLNWNSGDVNPAIDLFEDDANYFVQAELPGFNRKEIHVELENEQLILRGDRKTDSKEGKSEISFHRSVTIPNAVKADKVSAKYEDGLLTVTIPKAEEVKPLQIEVQS